MESIILIVVCVALLAFVLIDLINYIVVFARRMSALKKLGAFDKTKKRKNKTRG